MKRKDLDHTSLHSDDFIDLSLSSRYRKLRRLDWNVDMDVGEEENSRVSMLHDQGVVSVEEASTSSSMVVQGETPLVEDRAIVLYKPINTPSNELPSSSDFLIVLNSDLVPALKDLIFRPDNLIPSRTTEEEAATAETDAVKKDYLAVVPWVGGQLRISSVFEEPVIGQSGTTEAEGDVEMMDEDTMVADSGTQSFDLHQQPPWSLPQLVRNASTSVTWPQIGSN